MWYWVKTDTSPRFVALTKTPRCACQRVAGNHQRALSGESVSFSGREFSVADAVIKPTPRIPIPVLVGGSDAALTRAGLVKVGLAFGVPHSGSYAVDTCDEAVALRRNRWIGVGYQPWVGVDRKSSEAFNGKKGMKGLTFLEKFERYTPSGTPRGREQPLC